MNVHNSLWSSLQNDAVGHQIVSSVEDLDLVILNNEEPTYLPRYGTQKLMIDISLCTANIASKITWSVLSDTLGSNHFAITMNFSIINKSQETIYPKIKKTNWSLYTSLIENMFSNKSSSLNTNENYNFLIYCINDAAIKSIPQYKILKFKNRSPPPWWDPECDLIINSRKEPLAVHKRSPSFNNYLKCQKITAHTKKQLKQKAKASWIKWCSNLSKNTSSKEIWSQANKMNRKSHNSTKPFNDTLLDDFFNKVSPPWVQHLPTQPTQSHHSNYHHFLLKPFIKTESDFALKNHIITSPGIDHVKYPMLINLPKVAKNHLLHIFNDIIQNNIVIDSFKNILVVPIVKPGKDPNIVSSYRPISLLSCAFKTLKSLLKFRLDWWIQKENLLPVNQFGYKRGFGTLDALTTLIVDVQNNLTRNNYLIALFLDIEGAYESVCLSILKFKMVTVGGMQIGAKALKKTQSIGNKKMFDLIIDFVTEIIKHKEEKERRLQQR
ncbi:uncharacterized protein [Diabrotica undecimpunctata]|uniref:uncharacterized protein n=1 Tax=Diabrotica undecimpunctata TaxID=50387 RepID=UPI003B633D86